MAALFWARPAGAQSPGTSATPTREQDAPRVLVHVAGASDALLQQDARGDGNWTTVCTGSCDTLLPLGPAYRIDGDGMRTSSAFNLDAAAGGHVTLAVCPGRTGRFALGIVLEPAGFAALVGGLFWAWTSLATGGGSEANEPPPPSPTPGYVVAGLGAAAIIGGIVLIVHDATTDVQQQNSARANPVPPSSSATAPVWREPTPEERALPVATVAPLWGVRF